MEPTASPLTLTEQLLNLLDDALDCCITEEQFWNMSIGELNRAFSSYIRRAERDKKNTIKDLYTLADLVAYSMARLFDKEAVYEPVEKYFPSLFPEEYEALLEREELAAEQQFIQLAQLLNNRFKDA